MRLMSTPRTKEASFKNSVTNREDPFVRLRILMGICSLPWGMIEQPMPPDTVARFYQDSQAASKKGKIEFAGSDKCAIPGKSAGSGKC